MTDNFRQLKRLMDFSDEEKFYYLQILARSKDGNSKATKVIKNYYIANEEYLDEHEEQIKGLCEFFHARAYLRLNRRNYKDVAHENLKQIANSLSYEQYEFVRKSYSKACGRTNDEENKIWIVDIDENLPMRTETETLSTVIQKIKELHTEIQKDYTVLDVLETPNGKHILSNPFNVKKFKDHFGEHSPDIKKDNPTILYANI